MIPELDDITSSGNLRVYTNSTGIYVHSTVFALHTRTTMLPAFIYKLSVVCVSYSLHTL